MTTTTASRNRDAILKALAKPLKLYAVMSRANIADQEACHVLLMEMRDEGLVKFDIKSGRWSRTKP